MKPRRVLHITREHDGGLVVVLNRLLKRLSKEKYEPIVAFYTPKQSNIRKKISESDIKTIDLRKRSVEQVFYPSKTRRRRDIGRWVKSHFGKSACDIYLSLKFTSDFFLREAPKVKLFLRIIRENDIDMIHTHSNLHYGKSEIIAAHISGVPCITHNHAYQKYTFFDRIFSKFVTSFIYISKDIAEQYIFQGEPRAKGKIIYNGVDISKFVQANDIAMVRQQYNIRPKDILIGIIGRIDWWKGQDYFIEAIGQVVKTMPNLKGLIIGGIYYDHNGRNLQYMNRLRSLVKFFDIDDKIIFTGFRCDIPRLISSLDLVVHASSEPEPFGLVIIEGMAAAKPIIATAAGGVLDIVDDGVNGILVPCKDASAMAQAILKIISNPEWARQIGHAARRRVAERFTIQQQVTALQQLYDSILDAPRHQ
jgi:glycosyltransferase involved in cell wall biosynthesis